MKKLSMFIAMFVSVAGLCACGDGGTTSQTLTPVGTTVNLTEFKGVTSGTAITAGTQYNFPVLTGSDNQGSVYSGSYARISDGATTFDGQNMTLSREVFTTQRGVESPVTSTTSRYFKAANKVIYKIVSSSGITSTPASWNLPTGAIPSSAKVGDFGSANTLINIGNNSDGTSYTFAWSLNADVNGGSQFVISLFRSASASVKAGTETTTYYLDANGNPTRISVNIWLDTLRINLSGNRV